MEPKNIAVFGETGVSKSSLINLLAGRNLAKIAPDTRPCTMSSQKYTFAMGNRAFNVFDTVGLEEPEMGVNGYLPAIEEACDLTTQLASKGGVDLLFFCIRGDKITANTQSNYRLLYEALCRSQVPIALVITHLERESRMEDWWERNAARLEKYGIKVAGHACVAGLPTHSKYRESQQNMAKLLEGFGGHGKFQMPSEGWFTEVSRSFGMSSTLKKEVKKKDTIKALTKRCGMDLQTAVQVADMLERHGHGRV